MSGLGFEDTLTQSWGAEGAALAHTVQSPFAAMPSGHVAFAVIVAAARWSFTRRPAVRTLAVAYPLTVTVLVMATANHLWVDAVAGVLAALGGLAVARAWRGALAVRGCERGATGARRALVPIDL